jgi:hypothetical protein
VCLLSRGSFAKNTPDFKNSWVLQKCSKIDQKAVRKENMMERQKIKITPWSGGESPVPEGTTCLFKFRDKFRRPVIQFSQFVRWSWDNSDTDIVGYAVIDIVEPSKPVPFHEAFADMVNNGMVYKADLKNTTESHYFKWQKYGWLACWFEGSWIKDESSVCVLTNKLTWTSTGKPIEKFEKELKNGN